MGSPMLTIQNPALARSEEPKPTIETCRADFPILQRTVHGHPLVYLDSTASSQKPEAVLAAMDTFYRTTNANIHRGVYELSEVATTQYESARVRIGAFINAKSSR